MPLTKGATVFTQNKEQRAIREYNLTQSAQAQFAKEFENSKTKWDSFIDGLNRLPRPIFVFGVIYFFYLSFTNPKAFIDAMEAMALVPAWLWGMVSTIVLFFFGGRVYHHHQGRKEAKERLEKVKTFVENRKAINEALGDPKPIETQPKPIETQPKPSETNGNVQIKESPTIAQLEKQVIDYRQTGMSVKSIADALSVTEAYVNATLWAYAPSDKPPAKVEKPKGDLLFKNKAVEDLKHV